MKLNVVIPMAGLGSRFSKVGYSDPKPFIDVNGKPMIYRVLENLSFDRVETSFYLVARKEHLESHSHEVCLIKDRFDVTFIPIDLVTEGMACTVLFAHKYINNSSPLLLANSDQIVDIDFNLYLKDAWERDLDGSILTFKDKERNPKWSFVKVNDEGLAIEVREKEPISDQATVGIYFYKEGKTFVSSALEMIISKDRTNNEFYNCPTYNYAIKSGKKIGIFNIDRGLMHGIGTPEDLEAYLGARQ